MSTAAQVPSVDLLARAAGLDEIAATLGVINPAVDVARAARLLEVLPGDPEVLAETAASLRVAAAGLAAAGAHLATATRAATGAWTGQAADAARDAAAAVSRGTDEDVDRFHQASLAFDGLAAASRPLHEQLRTHQRDLEVAAHRLALLGGLDQPTVAAAVETMHTAAGDLRRLHAADDTAARLLRAVLGEHAPPLLPAGPVVPDQGHRQLGIDPPAPGQSGIQTHLGITVITLNNEDTTTLAGGLGVGGGLTTAAGAAATAVPPVAAAVAVLGAAGAVVGGLLTANRTPAGSRITLLGTHVVAVTGR